MSFSNCLNSLEFSTCLVVVAYTVTNKIYYILNCEWQLIFVHIDIQSPSIDTKTYHFFPNESLLNYTKHWSCCNTSDGDLAFNSYSPSTCVFTACHGIFVLNVYMKLIITMWNKCSSNLKQKWSGIFQNFIWCDELLHTHLCCSMLLVLWWYDLLQLLNGAHEFQKLSKLSKHETYETSMFTPTLQLIDLP